MWGGAACEPTEGHTLEILEVAYVLEVSQVLYH